MLPKPNRLPKSAFQNVFKRGKRIHSPNVTCIVTEMKEPVSRFAFVISTTVAKHAADRNRMKRLLRESIRHLLPTIQTSNDCILIAKRNFAEKPEAEIELEFKHLITQI